MAYPNITSGNVMDGVSSLMNDTAKAVYTYTVQLPYLNIALQELQELFEINEVPMSDTVTSTPMTVVAGIDHISFTAQGSLILPNDLVEPQVLWERTKNTNPYVPMTKVDVLPHYLEGTTIPQFIFYVWQSQEIRFFAASQDNDIKMEYIRNLFSPFADVTGNDTISIINAKTYLEFETASLCAEFIGENRTRATDLAGRAVGALDRIIGIGTKGRQSIATRRRPFRSGFKRRAYI